MIDPKCPVNCPKNLLDKIQIRQIKNCNLLFTQCKLGKSIWQKTPANDFTFYDPHNRETPSEYNPLLDPYLKPFFLRKVHLNHLRKNNFITEKNEVVCSVKDFNSYRKLLHRLRTEAEASNKRMQNVHDLDWNRYQLSNLLFEKIAKKKENFLKKYGETDEDSKRCLPSNPMRYGTVLEVMKRRKLEQECQRMAKFMTGIDKYKERLNEIEQQQHLKKIQLDERAFYRNLDFARKKNLVADKHRERQIRIKKKISADDKTIRVKKINSRPKKISLVVKCPVEI